MKIARLDLHAYRLPLTRAWEATAGGFAERCGWLLRVSTIGGDRGFGDCAPMPASGDAAAAAALGQLRRWQRDLPGAGVRAVLDLIAAGGDLPPAARCGLETALLDLVARQTGLPLWRLLGGPEPRVAVNATLGALERLAPGDVATACADGFRVLKIKIGVEPAAPTLRRIESLAGALAPGAAFRLDANRAYDADAARTLVAGLAGLPVEGLEEPLRTPEAGALGELQTRAAFALAIDESLPAFDPDILLRERPVRRLVFKPMRDGGLLPALGLARRAAGAGLECVVTGSVDGACGALAAAHLAAAIGNGLAHGLATSRWLAADIGTPPPVAGGTLLLPDAPGLGFAPPASIAPIAFAG